MWNVIKSFSLNQLRVIGIRECVIEMNFYVVDSVAEIYVYKKKLSGKIKRS